MAEEIQIRFHNLLLYKDRQPKNNYLKRKITHGSKLKRMKKSKNNAWKKEERSGNNKKNLKKFKL